MGKPVKTRADARRSIQNLVDEVAQITSTLSCELELRGTVIGKSEINLIGDYLYVIQNKLKRRIND